MAWPPAHITNVGVVNADPQFNTHPELHNAMGAAINDIIDEINALRGRPHATFRGANASIAKNTDKKITLSVNQADPTNSVGVASGNMKFNRPGLWLITAEGSFAKKNPLEAPGMMITDGYPKRQYDASPAKNKTITVDLNISNKQAVAAAINVTCVPGKNRAGYISVWGSASNTRPTASWVNFNVDTSEIANAGVVGLHNGDNIKLFVQDTSPGTYRVIVDVQGIWVSDRGTYGERGMAAKLGSTIIARNLTPAIAATDGGVTMAFMQRVTAGQSISLNGEFLSDFAVTHSESMSSISANAAWIGE